MQFPVWSHEVVVVRDPASQRYVAFFSGQPKGNAPVCTLCTDGTTAKACKKHQAAAEEAAAAAAAAAAEAGRGGGGGRAPAIEIAPPTLMAHSLTADARGAWSAPVLVSAPHPMMDINAAPILRPDGSLVGLWRDHRGSKSGKYSAPKVFTAENWTDPKTYKWDTEPIFKDDKAVTGGLEDMSALWVDGRGVYHVLFHLMFGCDTCGAHAFSTTNGSSWTYTGQCYNAATQYTDHPPVNYPYCERPHLVLGAAGEPVALTNGVKKGPQPGLANDDQSFTLLRPLNTVAAAHTAAVNTDEENS
eukprot:SAG22_NODE_533_length_9401_cov_5.643625_3_plen_302_part_00